MPLLTSKGQITIPEPIRREMGWKPGDALAFTITDGAVTVTKAVDVDDLLGIARTLSERNGDPPWPDVEPWAEQRDRAWDEEARRFTRD